MSCRGQCESAIAKYVVYHCKVFPFYQITSQLAALTSIRHLSNNSKVPQWTVPYIIVKIFPLYQIALSVVTLAISTRSNNYIYTAELCQYRFENWVFVVMNIVSEDKCSLMITGACAIIDTFYTQLLMTCTQCWLCIYHDRNVTCRSEVMASVSIMHADLP